MKNTVEYSREYNRNNKHVRLAWRLKNKEKLKEKNRKWYEDHREYFPEYRKNNSKQINAKAKLRRQRNRLSAIARLKKNLRMRITMAMKRNKRGGSAVRDLGCSIQEFRKHIESKFQDGMSWENYGLYGWHLDHIVPLAEFDLTNREQFLKAVHYTNLQPLWAKQNLRKAKKLFTGGSFTKTASM